MASYKIAEVKDDYVYCVVTNEDGSTFGQMVYGTASKTEASIEQAVMDAIKRLEDQERPRETAILEAATAGVVKELVSK